jgi:hypothetical protein
MDYSVTFARHFVRLVWLLSHEPAGTDEQKAALRALVALSKDGPVTLSEREELLTANDASVPVAFAGVAEMAAQMAGHGVDAITIDAGTSAAHLLGVARILATARADAPGDAPGTTAEKRRAALGATTVTFTSRRADGVLRDRHIGEMAHASAHELVHEPEPVYEPEPVHEPIDEPVPPPARAADENRIPSRPLSALLAQLDQVSEPAALTGVLDDLAVIAESAAHGGTVTTVIEILARITKRETEIHEAEAKHAVATSLRRLATPPMMRMVAAQLPDAAAKTDELIAVLAHAGDDGAVAVVEQLAGLTAQSDGRAYFSALTKLPAGIPALVQLLDDSRWFVVRSAADALGDMQARDAEQPLTTLMRHEDARVRNGARGALMRLGTQKALVAIQEALRGDDVAMRMQAALAMGGRKDAHAARTLVHAFTDEKDEEVQAAQLRALGKLGTREAVEHLLEVAAPEQGLFKKKSSALRVAAVKGLAEAGTGSAMMAVRKLATDKDESVREAAAYAARRRTGSSKP